MKRYREEIRDRDIRDMSIRHRDIRHRDIRHRNIRHKNIRDRVIRDRSIRHRRMRHKVIGNRSIRHKNIRGYMTLEAAFIIPWVIFIFVFLIYAAFYLYDKCVLFQDAYTVCFRASIQKEENGISDYLSSHMESRFGRKYFGVGTVEKRAEWSDKEVSVYGACSVKIPFGHFLTMAGKSGWQIQTQAKAQIMNPVKIIRRCRMAENVVRYIQE